MRIAVFCALASACLVCAADIPSGTQLEVRLTTTIDSAKAKIKDPVEFVVIAPVVVEGEMVLATGKELQGQIKDVKQPAKADDQAIVEIQFDRLLGADGQKAHLSARLVSVDNARETVDGNGRIVGI